MSTGRTAGIVLREKPEAEYNKAGLLDEYISMVLLERTVGEVFKMRETAINARAFWVANLVFNAIIEKDIGVIAQLASRVDGGVPTAGSREAYANMFGNAIEDVMDYDRADRVNIYPDDTCLIAIAKVIVQISLEDPGKNYAKKKEKQQAVEMIFARTGGRKTEPTKFSLEASYTRPDWLKGALGGGDDGSETES